MKARVKALVKRKGKIRTVTKTVVKYVVADFTWKDPIAAQRAGKSLKDYVIGGMDRGFKLKLYYALRTMEDAGLMPGITSAFRDDYRQGIASGNKAASDSSYHGGSRRGGYGHGLAADLVSVKGETRMSASPRPSSCGSGSTRARRSSGSAPVPRPRPAACRADRRQGVCRQARQSEGETRAAGNEQASSGRRQSGRDEPRSKTRTSQSGKHLTGIENRASRMERSACQSSRCC